MHFAFCAYQSENIATDQRERLVQSANMHLCRAQIKNAHSLCGHGGFMGIISKALCCLFSCGRSETASAKGKHTLCAFLSLLPAESLLKSMSMVQLFAN
jgi:hypothetical protein